MISIAIVEDHLVLVEALELLLSSEGDISIAGSADNFADGQEMLQHIRPDVLLLDVGLPDGNGLDLIPIVQAKTPETKIIILSCLTDENTLIRAIDGGVTGFISKGSPLAKLMSTIRKVAKGEIVLPSSLLFGLLKRYPRDKAVVSVEEQLWERLTPRRTGSPCSPGAWQIRRGHRQFSAHCPINRQNACQKLDVEARGPFTPGGGGFRLEIWIDRSHQLTILKSTSFE